jgi:hypothetical protein
VLCTKTRDRWNFFFFSTFEIVVRRHLSYSISFLNSCSYYLTLLCPHCKPWRSIYTFDNCILRSWPGDNAHVYIYRNLYIHGVYKSLNLLMDVTFIILYLDCQSIICALELWSISSYPATIDPPPLKKPLLSLKFKSVSSTDWTHDLWLPRVLFTIVLWDFHSWEPKFNKLQNKIQLLSSKIFNFTCIQNTKNWKSYLNLAFKNIYTFCSHIFNC